MKQNREFIFGLSAMLLFGLTCLAQSTAPAGGPTSRPEPAPIVTKIGMPGDAELFGDAASVKLLADLTGDVDPLVREQVIRNLGQTHNVLALPMIRKALSDESENVRAAAVVAAADLQQGAWQSIVLDGLKSDKIPPVLASLRMIHLLPIPSAAADVVQTLSSTDPQVQAECLLTLTTLGVPAPVEKLAAMLKSDSIAVRAFAAQNAALLDAAKLAALTGDLTVMAQNDVPSARMYALTVLGKFAYDKSSAIIARAGTDDNPLVRCGAVKAAQNAGKAQTVATFLNDPSVMVRLAAIQACGALKIESSAAKIFELLCAAPVSVQMDRTFSDEQTRQAALVSLGQIGSDFVAATAAEMLAKQYELYREAVVKIDQAVKAREKAAAQMKTAAANKTRQAGEIQKVAKDQFAAAEQNESLARAGAATVKRNIQSLCRLMGDIQSDKGFDVQVEMLKALPTNSVMLIDIAYNWSQLPQKRDQSAPLLRAKLDAMAKMLPAQFAREKQADVPYDSSVTSAVILALGKLQDAESLSIMRTFIDFRQDGSRRIDSGECDAVMESLGCFTGEDSRKSITTIVLTVLKERGGLYAASTRFMAARTAGRLGLTETAAALEKIVTTDRDNRSVMRMAAWACQKLTGKPLTVGDPEANEGSTWVVKKNTK